ARCAILGYGGIGKEIARLVRTLGATVIALNTSGRTDDPAEACYRLAELTEAVAQADVIFCCLPLTDLTRGCIGREAFAAMRENAVFLSLSRGEVIDETALFQKLRDCPDFNAGIDAWWVEPVRHGRFETRHPFLEMPNVIASPHNSAVVPGSMDNACRVAVANLKNYLTGGPVTGIARSADWLSQG
ncbi:MAG: NAD(P)-dependent oxidoreductase, partial [Pseudomonadota bacterium]|nr:NAD(P)-dependent oxidoreductase [Pseudomonadota bacterium]